MADRARQARPTLRLPPRRAGLRRAAEPRRPFRDNPRLILLGHRAARRGARRDGRAGRPLGQLSPDFLSEVVLYALSAADLTMLVALVFVLARNIIKLIVERRRALPFARFRAKLVAVLLGMTLIPAVLVLIVGSELIRNSADRWFSAPIDEVLTSATEIASDYYQRPADDRQRPRRAHRARAGPVDLARRDVTAVRGDRRARGHAAARRHGRGLSRGAGAHGRRPEVMPVVDVAVADAAAQLRARIGRPAGRAGSRRATRESRGMEPLGDGGELVRAADASIRAADRARSPASWSPATT